MNAAVLPAMPALPAATPTPGPSPAAAGSASAGANEPSAFARELQSAQTAPATATPSSPSSPPSPSPSHGPGGAAKGSRGKSRAHEGSDGASPTAEAKATGRDARAEASRQRSMPAEDGSEPARRALQRWLAAARGEGDVEVDGAGGGDPKTARGEGPQAEDDWRGGMPTEAIAGIALQHPDTSNATAPRGAAAATRAGSDRQPDALDATAATPTATAGAGDVQAADGAQGGAIGESQPLATPSSTQPMPGFPAELARHTQAISDTAANAAPGPEIRLPTPVHSPQFVPHLSSELVLLAREGVQEARVQVHPAELGPIAVQITLEGNAAQVRLAVDSALTRDLLEQGLPTLAAALRESGLTLTGGGVFQQPREPAHDGQGGQGGRSSGQGAGGAPDDTPPTDDGQELQGGPARLQRLRQTGRLDVFA